jgi:hypothetical protein
MERTAGLHESTVQAADQHVGEYTPRRRRRRRPRSSDPVTQVVHPDVMKAAQRIASSRPGTRLRIVDATTVLIENA